MVERSFFKEWGLILATTIGAGVFALPYVFLKAGWLMGFLYLLVFGGLITFAHLLYWRVLVETGKQKRLLGLAREYFGALGFEAAFLAVVGGLVLALVVYLILGSEFLELVWPGFSFSTRVLIFWAVATFPLFFKLNRWTGVEILGGILMVAIVLWIFISASPIQGAANVPSYNLQNLFLPFGVILFSLAGWTAIEPIFDAYRGRSTGLSFKARGWQFAFGTFGAALVSLFFVLAILGSAKEITPDTVSGLTNWPASKLGILGVFGLFAIWTSYLPIGREIENLMVKDLKFSRKLGLGLTAVLPLVLVFLGLKDFLAAVSLVGGVFLAFQYFFLVAVAGKVLSVAGFKKFWFYLAMLVFLLGAGYEIYYFVIR